MSLGRRIAIVVIALGLVVCAVSAVFIFQLPNSGGYSRVARFWNYVLYGGFAISLIGLSLFILLKRQSIPSNSESTQPPPADTVLPTGESVDDTPPGIMGLRGILGLFAFSVITFIIAVLVMGIWLAKHDYLELMRSTMGILTLLFLGLLPLGAVALRFGLLSSQFNWHFGFHPVQVKYLPALLAVLFCATVTAQQLAYWTTDLFPISNTELHYTKLLTSTEGMWGWPALLLWLAIVPGFCEELTFRGLLLRGLQKRMPFWLAALVSSILFAGLHLSPRNLPYSFLLGLVLAIVAFRTGGIWYAVLTHILYNMLASLLAVIVPDYVEPRDMMNWPVMAVMFVGLVASLFWLWKLSQSSEPQIDASRYHLTSRRMGIATAGAISILLTIGGGGYYFSILSHRGILGTSNTAKTNFLCWAATHGDWQYRREHTAFFDSEQLPEELLAELLHDPRPALTQSLLELLSKPNPNIDLARIQPALVTLLNRRADGEAVEDADRELSRLLVLIHKLDPDSIGVLYVTKPQRAWLLDLCQSNDPNLKSKTEALLKRLLDVRGPRGRLFVDLVTDADEDMRIQVLRVLANNDSTGQISKPADVEMQEPIEPALALLIDHFIQTPRVCEAAAALLRRINWNSNLFSNPTFARYLNERQYTDKLARRLLQYPDRSEVQASSSEILRTAWAAPEARATLFPPLLFHSDTALRRGVWKLTLKRSVRGGASIPDFEAFSLVTRGIADPDKTIAGLAMKAVTEYPDLRRGNDASAISDIIRQLIPDLCRLARSDDPDASRDARRLLGKFVGLYGIECEILEQVLSLADPQTRTDIYRNLRARGEHGYVPRFGQNVNAIECARAVEILLNGLQESDAQARQNALRQLCELTFVGFKHVFQSPEVIDEMTKRGLTATLVEHALTNPMCADRAEFLLDSCWDSPSGAAATLTASIGHEKPAVRAAAWKWFPANQPRRFNEYCRQNPEIFDSPWRSIYRACGDSESEIRTVAQSFLIEAISTPKMLESADISLEKLAAGMVQEGAVAALIEDCSTRPKEDIHTPAMLLILLADYSADVQAELNALLKPPKIDSMRRSVIRQLLEAHKARKNAQPQQP